MNDKELLEKSTGKLTIKERLKNVGSTLESEWVGLTTPTYQTDVETFADNIQYCIDALEDVKEAAEEYLHENTEERTNGV